MPWEHAAATGAELPRSPRKSRRSSMEMLSLPSIHDTGEPPAEVAGSSGARKRTAEAADIAVPKRMRLEVRCKEEPKEEEAAGPVGVKAETEAAASEGRPEPEKSRIVKKAKKKRECIFTQLCRCVKIRRFF